MVSKDLIRRAAHRLGVSESAAKTWLVGMKTGMFEYPAVFELERADYVRRVGEKFVPKSPSWFVYARLRQ